MQTTDPHARAAQRNHELAKMRHDPEAIRHAFETGAYPYKTKIRRSTYEKHKAELQVELLKVQKWVEDSGQKVVILFEGRDAAGKGGTIKRFMEHLNPRAARVVALPKPGERQRTQWFFQRYIEHLPADGEMVFFDRSWYNRAGVERVMDFCTPNEYLEFMRQAPDLERMLVRSGIRLFKYWFSVTREEQHRRFEATRRSGLYRQVGRLHRSQGSHVLQYRHGGCALGDRQIRRQEACPAELYAAFPLIPALPGQGSARCPRPRSADRWIKRSGDRSQRSYSRKKPAP